MAYGRVLCRLSELFIIVVFISFILSFKPDKNETIGVRSIFVKSNAGKYYHSTSPGMKQRRFSIVAKAPSWKVRVGLRLLKLSICAGYLVLLSGDVSLNPGPVSFKKTQTRGLFISHLNVRSLLAKIDQLKLDLVNNKGPKPDIMTLSETWLDNSVGDEEVNIPGYSILRLDRQQNKSGGGVAIYYRNGLVCRARSDLINENEAMWIEVIRTRCKSLVIGSIYRPPTQSIDIFVNNLNDSLTKIDSDSDKIVLGDFNIDFNSNRRNANSAMKKKLLGVMNLYDLKQKINLPTRITEHSSTLIDLIFTNAHQKIVDLGVVDPGLSDHSLVFCVLKSGLVKVPPKVIEFRSFKNYNKQSFVKDLGAVPWHVAFNNSEDIDDCLNTWNKLFLEVADLHAPVQTRKVRGQPTPWMTADISKCMKDRDFHLKKAKGNKSGHHWSKYRQLRNKVHRLIKKSKSQYYTSLIENSKGNTKDFWRALKEVLPTPDASNDISCISSDGIAVTSSKSIASIMNSFFVNIGSELAKKFGDILQVSAERTIATPAVESTFHFNSISEKFVSEALHQLKANKAVGLDKISARLLKDAASVITPSLTTLFNLSLRLKKFPSLWKDAKVVPLFKKGDKQNPSNYRPVSVLPTLSKILEKAVHSQLYSYLTENDLLSPKQFGFRRKASTAIATAKFTDEILHSMDKGSLTGVVFLDLTKAFDTVNHRLLLSKLSAFGVDSSACEWFGSFLYNRSQVTVCNGTQSDREMVPIGVAQGSILGPLMFIIFINDLPNGLEHCQISMYADDTALFYSSKSSLDVESKINSDLNIVGDWLNRNQLTLNISKSKFMLIGSSIKLQSNLNRIDISVMGKSLDSVDSFNYLGVVINKNLSWDDHIESIKNKINKKLGLLRRVKKFLPHNARVMFFNSFVLPLFEYADIVWGDRGNVTLMSELQVLHNNAARIILDLPPYASASEALDKLNWKKLEHRRAEHRAIFMFKCHNNLLEHRFNFSLNSDFHKYNTRFKDNVRATQARTRWGHWSSVNFAAPVWNSIDLSIRNSVNLQVFKNRISKLSLLN